LRKINILCAIALVFAFVIDAGAQEKKKQQRPASANDHGLFRQDQSTSRCGTMEHLEAFYNANPGARQLAEMNANKSGGNLRTGDDSYRLESIATLPVVVHVVMPNPNLITDADVNYFINRLNLDFSGLNPDSANAGGFTPIRGHSQIRFCRARRSPTGAITTGVQRRSSATLSNVNLAVDPIKRAALGGLDSWDNTSYINVWVGLDAGGVLGYATFPGTAGAADDGIFLNAQSFANNACYTIPQYNLARTAVHEVGHYMGLFHIWGDEGGCNGDDFRQLPGSCIMPTGLFNPAGQGNTPTDVGDTPNQGGATTNCGTGVVLDACATAAPGKMYQNYMDYTSDACYSMFTNKQVARMEWAVTNCRASLTSSLGCNPPVGFPAVDAALTFVVSPGGSEFSTALCNITNFPAPLCPGLISPRVHVTNTGATTLTSVTASVSINGGAAVTQTFPVNLLTNQVATLVFANQSLVLGNNTVTFTIVAANGAADAFAGNNTISTTVVINPAIALPFSQNFVATTFPPANMTIANPNGNFTWIRNAAGNGNVGSAFINNYDNNNPGQTDDVRTFPIAPPPGATVNDSIVITFDVAHKFYPFAPFDVLSVLVSNDCGVTFSQVYSKSGATLATAGSSTASYLVPAATDWRNERIVLGGAFVTGGPIIVAIRNTNQYGNNIFLDNINITRKVDRDLSLSAILNPGASVCNTSFTPQVRVANNGTVPVTSFRVGYRIGAGAPVNQTFTQTIAPNASAVVNLTGVTGLTAGTNYTFTAYTADLVSASGNGDQAMGNDTLSSAFTVLNLFASPLVEGFESATFPPSGWSIRNGGAANTWVRKGVGNNSNGSAFFDNYNFNLVGEVDAMQSPAIRMQGADSVIISFDLAHKNYAGFNDRLMVKVSTDCGNTFATVFSRAGAALATAGASTADYTAPAPTDWRTQRISLSGAAYATGSVIVQFENTNAYGNNIFIDNINIKGLFRRDIELTSINTLVLCPPSPTPTVTVTNVGADTIRGFKVSYTVDGGAVSTTTLTGLSLPATRSIIVSLNPATGITTGPRVIKAYTWDPITSAGTGDPNPSNDTLTRSVSVVGIVPAPLVETFESATFPPMGWGVSNIDLGVTWQRTTNAAKTGVASAFVRNFTYTTNNAKDDLFTPVITYSGIDSAFLSFDLAAATSSYPGSAEIPLDTLEVFVTTDCGTTLTSVYKKWGAELQTVGNPNQPQTLEFIPNTGGLWRNEMVDLTPWASRSPIQLIFRNTNNKQNNVFIDNINVNTKTLPAKLKAEGFLIAPNPFENNFVIQHYLRPTDLVVLVFTTQ